MIKHVEIINKGGNILRGYLDMPENFNGEVVVMFHGFTGNKMEHAKHFINFSRIISKYGFASLRLDFYGNGESDGEFKDFTMDTLMSDAEIIINSAFNMSNVTKVTLLGFSMGGGVSVYMSSKFGNKLSKILLWSAAVNITDIIKRCFENSPKLENGNAQYGTFEISENMYDSLSKYNITEGISKFTNPVMLIHGRNDKAVEYLHSVRTTVLYPNSRLHIINTAGHGYDANSERDELYQKSLEFLLENRK